MTHHSSSMHTRTDHVQASFLLLCLQFALCWCVENIRTPSQFCSKWNTQDLEQSSIGLKMSLALWSSSCRMSFCAQAMSLFKGPLLDIPCIALHTIDRHTPPHYKPTIQQFQTRRASMNASSSNAKKTNTNTNTDTKKQIQVSIYCILTLLFDIGPFLFQSLLFQPPSPCKGFTFLYKHYIS